MEKSSGGLDDLKAIPSTSMATTSNAVTFDAELVDRIRMFYLQVLT